MKGNKRDMLEEPSQNGLRLPAECHRVLFQNYTLLIYASDLPEGMDSKYVCRLCKGPEGVKSVEDYIILQMGL